MDNGGEDDIKAMEEKVASPQDEKDSEHVLADQAHELYSGQRIITEIIKQNKTTCWPFMDQVDTVGLGLWDYEARIKEPMWLNKILEKFENSEYKSFVEFAKDFRLMVENCYRYNTTDHPISKKARRLEMFFESKLALLSKDIREKSTIAKTSDGRFATTVDGRSSSSRSSRSSFGSILEGRDHYNPSEFSNQPKLVHDFVRCEETVVADDEKLANHRERKQQQALYQQVAAAFVGTLECREEIKEIKICHFLPEIGLFLYLNESVLRLPALAMYNLEMGLIIPSDSLYLARIMTSFLCTYYERNFINQRPPMQFKTWERRLQQRFHKWFEMVEKHKSFSIAADKLFLCLDFFQAFNWKNPFRTDDGSAKSFLEFTYSEKAHVIKALCDSMTSFQGVQNNIAGMPCEQTRAMTLGEDALGNTYIYFSQFCGDDVRIYRHRQHGEWTFIEPPYPVEPNGKVVSNDVTQDEDHKPPNASNPVVDVVIADDVTNSAAEVAITDDVTNSAAEVAIADDVTNSAAEVAIADDVTNSAAEVAIADDVTNSASEVVVADAVIKSDCDVEIPVTNGETGNFPTHALAKVDANDVKPRLNGLLEKTDIEPDQTVKQEATDEDTNCIDCKPKPTDSAAQDTGDSNDASGQSRELFDDKCADGKLPNEKSRDHLVIPSDSQTSDRSPEIADQSVVNGVDVPNGVHDTPSSDSAISRPRRKRKLCTKSSSLVRETPAKTPNKRKQSSLLSEEGPANVRRSARKRAAVDYTKMMVEGDRAEVVGSNPVTPKKKPKSNRKQLKQKAVHVEEPVSDFGTINFEMVCDSVDSIRCLMTSLEEEHANAVKGKKHHVIIQNVSDLLERLKWLLGELEPWESRLEKARFDAKIRLKKEHDEILRAATTGNTSRFSNSLADPWAEEIFSKNTVTSGENWVNSTRDSTPNPLYVEDSDEDSERELRRSRRKPKKYEEDDDYVAYSSDDESSPSALGTQFMFDEADEERKLLLPAALKELEVALEAQTSALQKLLALYGYDDVTEASGLGLSERRTRQKSKRESKVFRKILLLASKYANQHAPSLLPLIRADQVEINEVVDKVLAKAAVAKQQRKLAREQEERRRRLVKQAVQQQRRNNNKVVKKPSLQSSDAEPPDELEQLEAPQWTKPTKQPLRDVGASPPSSYNVSKADAAENVMIRLQNGKVCQALRFADGRIAPIVRVDGGKPAASFDDLFTAYGGNKPKQARNNEVPYISLSGNRRRPTASILRKPTVRKVTPPLSEQGQATAAVASNVQSFESSDERTAAAVTDGNSSVVAYPALASGIGEQGKQAPVGAGQLPTTLKQKVALASGQMISLMVPVTASKSSLQPPMVRGPSSVGNLGKFVVRVSKTVAVSRQGNPALVTTPRAAPMTASVGSAIHQPGLVRVVQSASLPPTYHAAGKQQFVGAAPRFASLVSNAPPASQPRVSNASVQLSSAVMPSVARKDNLADSEAHSTANNPALLNMQQGGVSFATSGAVQMSRQPVTYLTPAACTTNRHPTTQQLQLVQTVMTGHVPVAHNVQLVQRASQPVIPIQVQAPLMLVSPGQALPMSAGSGGHAFITSNASASHSQPAATEQSQARQLVFKSYAAEQ